MQKNSAPLLIAIGLFLSGDVLAEPRAQADLRIAGIAAGLSENGFSCAVEVRNYHDDRASDAALRILLPVGVRIALMPQSCSASAPADDGTVGVVSCALGEVPVGGRMERRVVTTIPPGRVRRSCGALVWSATPDPNPTNNQAVASLPQKAQAGTAN